MNNTQLSSFVDNLIYDYAANDGLHYDLDLQDLPDHEQEEFALKMFLSDECCMDFILDNPENVAQLLVSYMRNQSVDTAIEISHELRDLLIKNYAKRMQRVIDEQLTTLN